MKEATWQGHAASATKERTDGTGALEKALDLLDAIGDAPDGLSQAELAEKVGVPRTTTYRLLATLMDRGLVRRDAVHRVYRLGFRCFEMARQVHAMSDLVSAAAVELRALRDLTGETAYLAALEGSEVIGLERVDGAHSQRSQSVLGQRKPVHCTSQGKAILSALSTEAREAIVKELSLTSYTPLTITDRRRLQTELRVTAARGYAIDDEEIVMGIRCVGAPIVDDQGQVRGAISVAGPAYRLTPKRLELLGPEVAEAARRVGAQLRQDQASAADPNVHVVEGAWAFQGAYPRWSHDEGLLYWADVLAPALHRADEKADHVCAEAEHPIVGLAVRGDQVWLAHRDGIQVFDAASGAPSGTVELSLKHPLLALTAEHDGADAKLWAAVELSERETAVGVLSADGVFAPQWRITDPVQCLRWNPYDQMLYATTPQSGALLVMQPGHPTLRRLASIPKGSGQVSGLAFDAQGGIWTALCDGWSIVRFTADGNLDRVVGLPVQCPTDVEVGGPNGDRVYVTSTRHSLSLDALQSAPLSGRLFQVKA